MPTLRPWQPADWPHFLALDVETAIESLGEATEPERTLLRERHPGRLADRGFTPARFAAPGAQLWVLEGEGQRYLGHLWLTDKLDRLTGARILEVSTMGLVSGSRGKGLGRVLMQKAEDEARAREIEVIELSVAGNNRRARELYKDLGYETTRRQMRRRLHPKL